MRLTMLSIVFALAASPASAHYQMLLPDKPALKKGETVTVVYQWGHPYEHQLFDAPKPTGFVVITPGGKRVELLTRLEAIEVPGEEGKKVKAWRVQYTPEERGDHVFVLHADAIFLEEEEIFVQDTVKTVVHVEAQKGWDALMQLDFEFEPLTRPYGLQPGLVFQARLQTLLQAKAEPRLPGDPPPPGALVAASGFAIEVERYHTSTPKELPPDEQITRVVKTDPVGVVTCTLPEGGWWGLTAIRPGGMRTHKDKAYPVKQRTTFWVHVDEKPR
jgi:cobalt/nickel transport protein